MSEQGLVFGEFHLTKQIWLSSTMTVSAGFNDDVSATCEEIIQSDRATGAGEDAQPFGPDNAVVVYCFPVMIGVFKRMFWRHSK